MYFFSKIIIKALEVSSPTALAKTATTTTTTIIEGDSTRRKAREHCRCQNVHLQTSQTIQVRRLVSFVCLLNLTLSPSWAAAKAARQAGPHAPGSKSIPEPKTPDCLLGLTFVFTGELSSFSRDEAVDLAKRFGGCVRPSLPSQLMLTWM